MCRHLRGLIPTSNAVAMFTLWRPHAQLIFAVNSRKPFAVPMLTRALQTAVPRFLRTVEVSHGSASRLRPAGQSPTNK